jgi:hypothetical protein
MAFIKTSLSLVQIHWPPKETLDRGYTVLSTEGLGPFGMGIKALSLHNSITLTLKSWPCGLLRTLAFK